MDKNILNDALKSIDPEKLDKVKKALSGNTDISSLLANLNVKKANDALKELNINPEKLNGVLSELKKNPEILNEIKNRLN